MMIRRLTAHDAQLGCDAIRAIKAPPPHDTFTVEYMQEFLTHDENVLIVATDDDRPVGFLLAYMLDRVDRDQRMVCLYEIAVNESHRRRGIGRAMIDVLKEECRTVDAAKTWLVTNKSNTPAVRLFASTGADADPVGDEVVFVYDHE